ncbi:MAG: hypothetical protein Q4C73_04650 [Eubacteriales bacterium]|nr:hypothetical protein [Eubacteriales bacterium]
MRLFNVKNMMLAAGCALLLSGCTESNIVKPEASDAPDFNIYDNIELDENQLKADWEDVCLDEDDYPMAAALSFELHPDDGYVDMSVVVKDGTTAEDAAKYADEAIKSFNDQIAIQDFSYGASEETSFGGFFQDNEIHLKLYEGSAYEAGGEPFYETTVPKDTYMTFDIS